MIKSMIKNKILIVFILLLQFPGVTVFASDGCGSCFISLVSEMFHHDSHEEEHCHSENSHDTISLEQTLCTLCICTTTHQTHNNHHAIISNNNETVAQTLSLPKRSYTVYLYEHKEKHTFTITNNYRYLAYSVPLRLRI